MKKKAIIQKLAAMAMTTVLAAATLAGCGNDGGESSSQEASDTQADSGSSADASGASAESGGVQDDEHPSWIVDDPYYGIRHAVGQQPAAQETGCARS